MRVYVILDDRSSPTHPLDDAIEMHILREDAERSVGGSLGPACPA